MNPKENLMKTIKHKKAQWVPCPIIDGSWKIAFHGLAERPSKPGFDDWGVYWELSDAVGGTYPTKHPVDKPEEVEDLSFPNVEKPDLLKPAVKLSETIDRTKCLLFGDNGWGIFERAWLLVGIEKLFIWMIEEPEVLSILMHRIADIKLRITERFIEEIKVDGVRYGDDWGSDTGLLMSPKFWRKFIKPEQERLYDICKRKGVLIQQHSDGNIGEIIPDLIEMGLDILNPLQPECNNVKKIKLEFGATLSFHGGIGSRLLDKGTSSQVTEEVRLRISQLACGGGYILAPYALSCYPARNLQAFKEASIKYGKIPKRCIENME